ncbi:MAG: hypothetical protein EOO89_26700, partial [Pedobacter sp.]
MPSIFPVYGATPILTLQSGNIITTGTYYVSLCDDATVTGGSSSSYIDGPIKKIGNDTFTFPVGKSGVYQPVGISAPSLVTDAFTAEYFHVAPPAYTGSINNLSGLSDCQYWNIERSNGTSNISVTLMWDSNTCTPISFQASKVVRYNSGAWQTVGSNNLINGGATGSITSDVVSAFEIFTYGEDLCGGQSSIVPLLHLTGPSNYTILDSLTLSSEFEWSIDSIPALSGLTDTKHTVILQVAEWESDPTTGAIPYWGNKIEFSTAYYPGVNPLTEGTYQKLMEDVIEQLEEDKNYFWRVGLQYLLPQSGIQPVSWSDTYLLTLKENKSVIPATYLTTSHTNDINWVYEVTYLDENKTNQVISYIDGLGHTRQNQVLLNSSELVMCTEIAYSEEAGGVVQSMVAPTGSSTFGYAHRFFDVKTGGTYSDFTTSHFDREIVGSS